MNPEKLPVETLLAQIDATDAVLSDESKWAKGYFGYTADGQCIASAEPQAVKWCLAGACNKATDYHADDLLDEIYTTLGDIPFGLTCWNDAPERTFADVKAALAATRSRLSSREHP